MISVAFDGRNLFEWEGDDCEVCRRAHLLSRFTPGSIFGLRADYSDKRDTKHIRQCWVALDRAIRLAQKRSLPLNRTRLAAERDRTYEAIM
jgi:hypothetical protein